MVCCVLSCLFFPDDSDGETAQKKNEDVESSQEGAAIFSDDEEEHGNYDDKVLEHFLYKPLTNLLVSLKIKQLQDVVLTVKCHVDVVYNVR